MTFLERNSDYRTFRDHAASGDYPLGLVGLPGAAKAHFIASALRDLDRGALVLTHDEPTAVRMTADLVTLGADAVFYPARDRNFRSDETRSREYERMRLGVLGRLLENGRLCVVASVDAARQFTVPGSALAAHTVTLGADVAAGYDRTVAALAAAGYSRADMVEGEGQFSVRGSIIDFFPPDSDRPVRVEFFGDDVDSISYFDIGSQRRGDRTGSMKITPAREIIVTDPAALAGKIDEFCKNLRARSASAVRESLYADADALRTGALLPSAERYLSFVYDSPETLFDYCAGSMLFVCDSGQVRETALKSDKTASDDIKMLISDGVLCKGIDKFSLVWEETSALYTIFDTVYIDNLTRGSFDTGVKELISCDAQQMPAWTGSAQMLKEDLGPDLERGAAAVLFAGTERSAAAVAAELSEEGIPSSGAENTECEIRDRAVTILPGVLSTGVRYPRAGLVIAAYGAYRGKVGGVLDGVRSKRTARAKPKANGFGSLDDLRLGDYVVHDRHGIGIFVGIHSVAMHGVVRDYIKIQYRGTDVLYVPVNQLDHIARYVAPGDESGTRAVRLSRLGSKDWAKTKARVKSAVRDIAGELIALYAKRQKMKGYAFSPDIDMQHDFETRFPYDETPDQLRCIDEIKTDMERPVPMDRLLCGDVGFGKTEVALRAVFKCICDGKQAAILVPTTILALQHYRTILTRLEGFPVETQMISRFRTAKEKTEILKKLAAGNIDVIVGTHALLGDKVKFRDLGLIIVDEEQRFGVAQKEKLKEKYPCVDVLTLSATPIPRTLNMSLTGIRDMSVIEDPPQDRLPVQTYVIKYDPVVIGEAIATELRRGGQVYYLYNRVDGIEQKAREISELVPDARIGVGHGKMSEEQLSGVWRRLVDGEIDVLVCTTIIETGVDVPNVNTLVIEGADKMGLAQLHQLRGRVGRSSRRAYAWFTYKFDTMSVVAESRLTAIREFTEFGSGFRIAMKDLEIRGAGSILGAQQHGHLEAVGYDMYLELLRDAVEEQKTGQVTEEVREKPECLLDVRVEAHIPEGYIESLPQRLAAYRRIASIETHDDAKDVFAELRDRYGEVPESVRGLIFAVHIRNSAIRQGIYEIRQDDSGLKLYGTGTQPAFISSLERKFPGRLSLINGDKEGIAIRMLSGEKPLDTLMKAFS